VHLNVRLPLGPLTPVIAGPQWHRIHHSIEKRHTDKNFASFFPVFDLVFGTYCKPQAGEYPATGLHSGEDLNHPVGATLSPFRDWYRMLRGTRQPALAQVEQDAIERKADQQGDAHGQQHDG
jgi:sterol desaturase/sphingolipid hydroxylase (fatty acid hydroxylase superfamily)